MGCDPNSETVLMKVCKLDHSMELYYVELLDSAEVLLNLLMNYKGVYSLACMCGGNVYSNIVFEIFV